MNSENLGNFLIFRVGDLYLRSKKLKVSIYTHMTHINSIFEYYHA